MDEPDPIKLLAIARLYRKVLRVLYGGTIAMPIIVLVAVLLPVNAVLFLLLAFLFLICFVAVFLAGAWLSDFVCPKCGLDCTYRNWGRGFPKTRCMNCGLSLSKAAIQLADP